MLYIWQVLTTHIDNEIKRKSQPPPDNQLTILCVGVLVFYING